MVRLSLAVMAHPSRAAEVERVVASHPNWRMQVAYDPAPQLGPGTLRTARAGWALVEPGATHHLVVQDDVLLPPAFFDSAVAAIAQQPDAALCFFAEWGSYTADVMRIAALQGASWAEVVEDEYVPTQALVLPADRAREFVARLGGLDPATPDDQAVLAYVRERGIAAYASVPNLVEHANAPSLVGNQAQGARRAACYSPALTAAGVPSGPVLTGLTCVPHFNWSIRAPECRVRDDPRATTWSHVAIRSWLAQSGVPAPFLDAAFAEAPRDEAGARLAERVGERRLRGLWITAFTFGFVARRDGGCIPEERVAEPVVRALIASIAPAGLRLVVDPGDAAWPADGLVPFMTHALSAGIARAESAVWR